MPNDKSWLVSNWISFGFFEDCLPHLSKAPHIASKIQFCIDAEVDTLDLRNAEKQHIQELKSLVSLVVQDNHRSQGSNFHSAEFFPVYLAKLQELVTLLDEML
jgi:hypothetical protein